MSGKSVPDLASCGVAVNTGQASNVSRSCRLSDDGARKCVLGRPIFRNRCLSEPQPLTARRAGPLTGRARVPGDKSISHRALILSALTVGETTITGLLEGEDVQRTAQAMRALGAEVRRTVDGGGQIVWRVRGVGVGGFAAPEKPLD